MLHIGRNAAYDIVKEGKIKTIRIGKRYIIPKTSVINFLETAS
jgi:excisionase family DNA binding protein